MSNLESRILDGEAAGYCSSSDDEGDSKLKIVKDDDAHQASVMGNFRNTGVKGVLEDYRRSQDYKRMEGKAKERAITAMAQRGMLSGHKDDDEEGDHEKDDDDLEAIRRQRLQEMRSAVRSNVLELQSKEQFLSAIEECGMLLVVHLYEHGIPACDHVHTVLKTLAGMGTYDHVQFCRIQARVSGLSQDFCLKGVPAVQVYREEKLIGNFVRIDNDIGDDFSAGEFLEFMKSKGINFSARDESGDSEIATGTMDDLSPGEIPAGVILVAKGVSAAAEQVLFAFPYTLTIPDSFVLVTEHPENAETEANPTAPPDEDENEGQQDEETIECSEGEGGDDLSETLADDGDFCPDQKNVDHDADCGSQSDCDREDDQHVVSDDETPEEEKPSLVTKIEYKKERPSESVQFGISTPMLAYLLAASDERPLEVKVDNIRFAGYPKKIESLSEIESITVSVVFVLPASAPAYIVESFQNLSRLVASAINFEQTRCNYFLREALEMQKVHDEIDSQTHQHKGKAPFEVILNRSQLAQTLREIYDDLREYGMVNAFINGFVEVGFCLETQAMNHAGLPPKSSQDLEAAIKKIRPYHGIILLEETIPSPDANPALKLFLKHCEPDKSLVGISLACGLPLIQVLMVVRHLILWGRAIVIFPLSGSNIYSSATDRQLPLNGELTDQYKEYFPSFHLADVLTHFAPPTTLSTFLENTNNDIRKRNERTNIICRLLRDQLIMQLHTFVYLMPPFQSSSKHQNQNQINVELPLEVVQGINRVLKNIEHATKSRFSEYIVRFSEKLYSCCRVIAYSSLPEEVLSALNVFNDLIPYLNGNHHIEDIMFRTNRERGDIIRVLDAFSPLTSNLCRPDFLCSD